MKADWRTILRKRSAGQILLFFNEERETFRN